MKRASVQRKRRLEPQAKGMTSENAPGGRNAVVSGEGVGEFLGHWTR